MNLLRISKFTITAFLLSSLLMGFNTGAGSSSIYFEAAPKTPYSTSSIWSDMGDHFTLPHYAHRSEVNAQIALLQRDPSDLYHILQSKASCISYVYEQTQQRGLPAELALLPVIESDFNPNAHSRAGASGLWQLMPQTASDLGLKNNHTYDGRRDIIASTDAALNYLNYLHESFKGNWLLAMAAYNSGPNKVESAVRHEGEWFGSATFWDLHRLPHETKLYVPKLLAIAEVIKNPDHYHIQLPAIASGPHLATVQVGAKVDLKEVAQKSGISVETMRQLNPGYRHMATSSNTPNKLLLPIEKAAAVAPTGTILATKPATDTPPVGILLSLLDEETLKRFTL